MRDTQKILIVDDEAPFRSALRRLLEKKYLVIEADTAAKGLQLCYREEPDLVLLDVALPDASGLEILSQFKEHRPSPTVVMITAYEQVKDVVTAIKRGRSTIWSSRWISTNLSSPSRPLSNMPV